LALRIRGAAGRLLHLAEGKRQTVLFRTKREEFQCLQTVKWAA